MNWFDYFTYDATTGDLIWQPRPREHFPFTKGWRMWNTRYSGSVAGSKSYAHLSKRPHRIAINIRMPDGSRINDGAHRIIWEMFNGTIPKGMMVDHEDGNPFNNLLSNLRLATPGQNCMNGAMRKTNKARIKGVRIHRNGKWEARIRINRRLISIGFYDFKCLAAVAYAKSALRYHGPFARFA